MRASEYRMIRGSLGPVGSQRESGMYRAEQRKNEATADRKASLIKDAAGERRISPYSHRKPNHTQVENCKMIFKYMLLWANKPNIYLSSQLFSVKFSRPLPPHSLFHLFRGTCSSPFVVSCDPMPTGSKHGPHVSFPF